MNIPPELVRRAAEVRGAAGIEWLQRLPSIVAACEQRWRLTAGRSFANLTYNYVAPAFRADGTGAVLKINFPDKEFTSEAGALRLFDGRGAARLLEADLEHGALLLERLEPGTSLVDLEDDEEATSIAARVMQDLWRPLPADHHFPTVADWGHGFGRIRSQFGGGSGPLPAGLFDEAERLYAELLNSSAEPVLLHGDLHHDNILAARRAPWLAIDPKGLAGEPVYETGAFLRNWLPHLLAEPDPRRILARRVDQFAEELQVDRARVRGWGFAQAVLSACWTVEDHRRGWEPAIACAEYLAPLR
ncbi:MAG: aminoglycoside phosphotransferase family protein [Dehalococcoidia bacterium]